MPESPTPEFASPSAADDQDFWRQAHDLKASFQKGLARGDARASTNALLEFDRMVWQAHQGLENEAVIAQARDTLRDMIVLLGNQLANSTGLREDHLAPLVEALLEIRQKLRREAQWEAADMLRDALDTVNITVEDTPDGYRWAMKSQ
ncbi:hypothetical protein [Desulfosarcina sp.]|uniref:CysS/YqeB C-terminal domain-containing protein n=1 Tax=Desulfosarcina sp. TaxID=2027861 RepID=UPI00356479AB